MEMVIIGRIVGESDIAYVSYVCESLLAFLRERRWSDETVF